MRRRALVFSLFIVILLSPVVFAEFQDVLLVRLEYDKGDVSLKGLSESAGFYHESKDQPEGAFNIVLLDKSGQIEFQERFNFPLTIVGSSEKLDYGEKRVYVPFSPDSKEVEVYSPAGDLVLEFDVSEFSGVDEVDSRDGGTVWPILLIGILIAGVLIVILLRKFKERIKN